MHHANILFLRLRSVCFGLGILGGMSIGLGGAAVVMKTQDQDLRVRSVEAQSITIRAEDGQHTVTISSNEKGIAAKFLKDEQLHLMLAVNNDGNPLVLLRDGAGGQLSIAQAQDVGGFVSLDGKKGSQFIMRNTGETSVVEMRDTSGHERLHVSAVEGKEAGMRIASHRGPRMTLFAVEDSVGQLIQDAHQKNRITLGIGMDGAPGLRLLDPDEDDRVVLRASDETTSGRLLGSDGEVLWSVGSAPPPFRQGTRDNKERGR